MPRIFLLQQEFLQQEEELRIDVGKEDLLLPLPTTTLVKEEKHFVLSEEEKDLVLPVEEDKGGSEEGPLLVQQPQEDTADTEGMWISCC